MDCGGAANRALLYGPLQIMVSVLDLRVVQLKCVQRLHCSDPSVMSDDYNCDKLKMFILKVLLVYQI